MCFRLIASAAQGAACGDAGQFTVFEFQLAIHEDVPHAFG